MPQTEIFGQAKIGNQSRNEQTMFHLKRLYSTCDPTIEAINISKIVKTAGDIISSSGGKFDNRNTRKPGVSGDDTFYVVNLLNTESAISALLTSLRGVDPWATGVQVEALISFSLHKHRQIHHAIITVMETKNRTSDLSP